MIETRSEPHRACEGCGRRLGPPVRAYQLRGPRGVELSCRACALTSGPLLRRSLRIAAIIGSVLLVINHGDVLLSGQLHAALLWKIPATFAVPFIVATWSALSSSRVR